MNDTEARNLQPHPSRNGQGPGYPVMAPDQPGYAVRDPNQRFDPEAQQRYGPQQGYGPGGIGPHGLGPYGLGQGHGPQQRNASVENYEEYDQEQRFGQPQEDVRKWGCDAFEEKSRRMAFVRKVLSIVALQLTLTAGFTAFCIFSGPSFGHPAPWIMQYYWLGFLGGMVWFVINIAVGCCQVGRGPPSFCNVTLLTVATMGLSVLCGFISSSYKVEVVIYSLSTTIGILIVLVIITVFTKIDITGWGIYLMVAGIFVVLGGFVASLVFSLGGIPPGDYSLVKVILAFIMVILLCFYILYDLQLIMGGRKYQLEEEDWLFACLILFGDIVYLFLKLLEIYNYFTK